MRSWAAEGLYGSSAVNAFPNTASVSRLEFQRLQRLRWVRLLAAVGGLLASGCGEIDACLDRGGSYDYQLERCDLQATHPGPDAPCVKAILDGWRVVGYSAPGSSAMSDAEASEWLGGRSTYSAELAQFEDYRCAEPTYESALWSSDDFIDRFRIPSTALGIEGARICVTEIRCGSSSWTAPGSLLLHSGEALITTWDGVFFTLARDEGAP